MPGPAERVIRELYGKEHGVEPALVAACEAVHAVCVDVAPGFRFEVARHSSPNVLQWSLVTEAGDRFHSAIKTQDMIRDPGLVLAMLLQARDSALVVTGRTTAEGLPAYLAVHYGPRPVEQTRG